MCGISICLHQPHFHELNLLKKRGPDSQNTIEFEKLSIHCTVLNHRGDGDFIQPFINDKFILAFNGEIYRSSNSELNDKITRNENDGKSLIECLNSVSIKQCFSDIEGSYSFLLLDKTNRTLYFGRDRFGRRPLYISKDSDGNAAIISSVPTTASASLTPAPVKSGIIYQYHLNDKKISEFFTWDFPLKRKDEILLPNADPVNTLYKLLYDSVKVRSLNSISPFCKHCSTPPCSHARVSVLFSGGLDSTIIVALLCKLMNEEEKIDLLNVSFERNNDFSSPDRETAKKSYALLKRLYPERKLNFVQINITISELMRMRSEADLHGLLKHFNTVLDESLGLAVWFASRGKGVLLNEDNIETEYTSPAKVVFTGIGADELMGGYSRHKKAFSLKQSYQDVETEMLLDIGRIGERNMLRDDLMISSHGKEGRFPFLDERVVDYLVSLDCRVKTDYSIPCGDKIILRKMSSQFLGLDDDGKGPSWFPKRAMQFGSHIAKVQELNPEKKKGHERIVE